MCYADWASCSPLFTNLRHDNHSCQSLPQNTRTQMFLFELRSVYWSWNSCSGFRGDEYRTVSHDRQSRVPLGELTYTMLDSAYSRDECKCWVRWNNVFLMADCSAKGLDCYGPNPLSGEGSRWTGSRGWARRRRHVPNPPTSSYIVHTTPSTYCLNPLIHHPKTFFRIDQNSISLSIQSNHS